MDFYFKTYLSCSLILNYVNKKSKKIIYYWCDKNNLYVNLSFIGRSSSIYWVGRRWVLYNYSNKPQQPITWSYLINLRVKLSLCYVSNLLLHVCFFFFFFGAMGMLCEVGCNKKTVSITNQMPNIHLAPIIQCCDVCFFVFSQWKNNFSFSRQPEKSNLHEYYPLFLLNGCIQLEHEGNDENTRGARDLSSLYKNKIFLHFTQC